MNFIINKQKSTFHRICVSILFAPYGWQMDGIFNDFEWVSSRPYALARAQFAFRSPYVNEILIANGFDVALKEANQKLNILLVCCETFSPPLIDMVNNG